MSDLVLKPCPACGSPAAKKDNETFISCSDGLCLLTGPAIDRDGTKWNALPRRGDNPGDGARLRKLREWLISVCEAPCSENAQWIMLRPVLDKIDALLAEPEPVAAAAPGRCDMLIDVDERCNDPTVPGRTHCKKHLRDGPRDVTAVAPVQVPPTVRKCAEWVDEARDKENIRFPYASAYELARWILALPTAQDGVEIAVGEIVAERDRLRAEVESLRKERDAFREDRDRAIDREHSQSTQRDKYIDDVERECDRLRTALRVLAREFAREGGSDG